MNVSIAERPSIVEATPYDRLHTTGTPCSCEYRAAYSIAFFFASVVLIPPIALLPILRLMIFAPGATPLKPSCPLIL